MTVLGVQLLVLCLNLLPVQPVWSHQLDHQLIRPKNRQHFLTFLSEIAAPSPGQGSLGLGEELNNFLRHWLSRDAQVPLL